MLIKHTESISFEIPKEQKLVIDFQENNPEWKKTAGTNTITFSREYHFMYVDERRKSE